MNERATRRALEAELERLEELHRAVSMNGRQSELPLAATELSSEDQHPADLGTDTFERERDVSIARWLELQVVDVRRALHRLDDGTYGACEACGRPIDQARLEALPATRFCLEDQARAEREAS